MKTKEEIEFQIKALENDLSVSRAERESGYRIVSLVLQIETLKWVLSPSSHHPEQD